MTREEVVQLLENTSDQLVKDYDEVLNDVIVYLEEEEKKTSDFKDFISFFQEIDIYNAYEDLWSPEEYIQTYKSVFVFLQKNNL